MGIFDFFKSSDNRAEKLGEKPKLVSKEVARWGEKAASKRAQTYDRQEAIAALADARTPEAAAALLKRFNFIIDPTITDQEEKQLAFEGIVEVGLDVLPVVREYAEKAESVAWPMKIVKRLVSDEAYAEELLAWLSKWDTEYAKFIDPKLQILCALEEISHARVREAVSDFLYDVNEPARFHAVGATLKQQDDASVEKLVDMFCDEESLRIRARVCEGFISRGWVVAEDRRFDFKKSVPSDFALSLDGTVRRK